MSRTAEASPQLQEVRLRQRAISFVGRGAISKMWRGPATKPFDGERGCQETGSTGNKSTGSTEEKTAEVPGEKPVKYGVKSTPRRLARNVMRFPQGLAKPLLTRPDS